MKYLSFPRRFRRQLSAIVFLLIFTLSLGQGAYALSPEQKRLFDINVGYYNAGVKAFQSCGASGSGQASATLGESIPSVWRTLINSVAATYPTADPRLVAATLWAENRGWPEYKTSGWGVSAAAAAGPWQFIPATWASMGTDGDGDGRKDRDNPKDAVHAAFKHQLGSTGKPIASIGYTGDAEADYNTIVFKRDGTNLLSFIAKYNGRGAPDGVIISAFPRNENSDYVKMGYWLLASDFTKGYLPGTDSFVDATKQGALFGDGTVGGASVSDASACEGISVNGYAFPVAPQRKSQNGGLSSMSALPCNQSDCHRGTPAFDISAQPGGDEAVGKPIYAITDGQIESLRPSYKGEAGCQSFQLKGTDGYYYWYGHIQNVTARESEQVTAGQQIAILGERRCTGNGSDPHLHIDRGCVQDGIKRPGGSDSCRDPAFVPLINGLFNALPE